MSLLGVHHDYGEALKNDCSRSDLMAFNGDNQARFAKCKSGVFRMVGCQLGPHQRAHSAHDLGDRCYWLNSDPTLARLGLK